MTHKVANVIRKPLSGVLASDPDVEVGGSENGRDGVAPADEQADLGGASIALLPVRRLR
jgi:hypothetical protein